MHYNMKQLMEDFAQTLVKNGMLSGYFFVKE